MNAGSSWPRNPAPTRLLLQAVFGYWVVYQVVSVDEHGDVAAEAQALEG